MDLQVAMPISRLWLGNADVRLWPPDEPLLWDLPKVLFFVR